jgi:DNA-binding NarL/FixJ family response regulator
MHPVGGEVTLPARDTLLKFVVETSNELVVVFDVHQTIAFRNDKARRFLDRHALPDEIPALVKKILTAIAGGKAAEMFAGQISLHREIGGRNWFFRLTFREGDDPLVVIFFTDATVSSRFDLNVLRGQHHLTRRETDVLRHLLDGLKNQEIAEELAITEQTVKDYLSEIYKKFDVPDRFALLRFLVCASKE